MVRARDCAAGRVHATAAKQQISGLQAPGLCSTVMAPGKPLPHLWAPVSLLYPIVKGVKFQGELKTLSPLSVMWRDHSEMPRWTGLIRGSLSRCRLLPCRTLKHTFALCHWSLSEHFLAFPDLSVKVQTRIQPFVQGPLIAPGFEI